MSEVASEMKLEVVALSKPGGRQSNEDACGVWSAHDACFCVLSDGAGGHGGGDVASKLTVRHALDWFRSAPQASAGGIDGALRAANQGIIDEQARNSRVRDMRATAVVLAVDTARAAACWGHIGDSRLYCFRDGRIVAQTRDHSVVQGMVDAGFVNASELRAAPERSKLLAALGDPANFTPAITEEGFPLLAGDTFLLCSDGLWELIDEAEMESTLSQAVNTADWLGHLNDLVIARGHGAYDNYSAIVLRYADADRAVAAAVTVGDEPQAPPVL